MKISKKTDTNLLELIKVLRKTAHQHDAAVWRDISEKLNRPRRLWSAVNLGHIDQTVKEGEVAVVPGKVLASGDISRKIDIVAYSFSESALSKIGASGGRAISISSYIEENPEGKKTRILG